MSMRVTVGMVIVGALIFVACDSNGAGGGCTTSATDGTVEIVSVDPSTGLVDGNSTTFTVGINYTATGGNAELNIGFNTGSTVSSCTMIQDATKVAGEGSGTHTFSVSATAKDWDASGNFRAYANISEYPHPDPWSPFGSDTLTLTFN